MLNHELGKELGDFVQLRIVYWQVSVSPGKAVTHTYLDYPEPKVTFSHFISNSYLKSELSKRLP